MADVRHLHLVAEAGQVATPAKARSGVGQLVLPGTEGALHATLVLMSFRIMVQSGVMPMIERFKPVLIIDLRMAPTFLPYRRGFEKFIEELRHAGTEYLHATPIVPTLDEIEALPIRYLARLRANHEFLAALATRARHGTVMLLSSDPRKQDTDRHLVADEMQRLLSSGRQPKSKPLEVINV